MVISSFDELVVALVEFESGVTSIVCVVLFVSISVEDVTDSVEMSILVCGKLTFVIVVVKIFDVILSVLIGVVVVGRAVADKDIVDK